MRKILLISSLMLVLLCFVTSCGHTHQWSEWQSSKEATCTQDGTNIRICDGCGENQSMLIKSTGHTFGEWNTTKEASCTQNGSSERKCACGEKETQTTSALGHTFGTWNTIAEATCTVNGTMERSCTCGEKETNTIFASHNWQNATCTEAKNCSKCGLTDGTALGHTCSIGKCTRCNTAVYPAINLPSTPIITWWYNHCTMKITEISYSFDSYGNLIISFSGEKTSGSSGLVGMTVKLLDEDGYTLCTTQWNLSGLNVGDKFKNQTVTIRESNFDDSSEYSIVISDYN